jgi:chorismate dehydratase
MNNDEYLIQTDDGSTTLFMEEYEQAMHSTSGAYEESLLKHVIPSGILKEKKIPVNVLDIGFGMGYNILALINEYNKKKRKNILNIISLEKNKSFAQFMSEVRFNDGRDSFYSLVKKAYSEDRCNSENINILVKFGDAREIIKTFEDKKFDAVFQDPFSPSKNPELWSLDYFKIIRRIIKKEGIITTYSSALQVRRALIEAGFHIGRGPSVGMKREGTIASPSPVKHELLPDDISAVMNDPKSVPYRDKLLSLSRELILQNRLEEIRVLKKMVR